MDSAMDHLLAAFHTANVPPMAGTRDALELRLRAVIAAHESAPPTDASGGVTEGTLQAIVAELRAEPGPYTTVTNQYFRNLADRIEAADRARKPDTRAQAASAGEPVAHVPNAEFCPHCNPCRNAIKFAEAERYAEDADSVLRGLMLYLSAGGAHGVYWIDTKQADKAIRWGIDHMLKCEFNRGQALAKLAAPTDGRSTNDVGYREVTLEDAAEAYEAYWDGPNIPREGGGIEEMLAVLRGINAVIRCPAGEKS